MDLELVLTVLRHAVPHDEDGLSPLQRRILSDPAPVRVFSAPTGAGKSYALIKAAKSGERVLFIVPTRRLAQNLAEGARKVLLPSAPGMPSPVAVWSSDETMRRRALDAEHRPMTHRVAEVRRFEEAQFVVATPESVASMLLRAPSTGPGSDPFGLSDLMHGFDHVVFDEFHSIDARGFGLCAVVASACADGGTKTRVTFLSATPIDVLPVLEALGISREKISVAAETVLDDPGPINGVDAGSLRVLHGDVRVEFVQQPDLAALLRAREGAIHACLASGRQLVVVLDSLEELQIQKERLAAEFDRLGVPASQRLAINSIDDSARSVALGRLFVTDRMADPVGYPVLLATSSVEMGVTFNAGMIVMDPGHDALSFVQRLGRVAREDKPGHVVVRLDPTRLGRAPWLRRLLVDLRRVAPDETCLPVSQFLSLTLAAARERFEVRDELQDDDVPLTFRSMPQRAVWAACLFWYALERAQPRHVRGQREALRSLRPAKVGVIVAKLRTLEGESTDHVGFGRRWASAFLAQAATLRDFEPVVTVVEPNGTEFTAVPLRLIEGRPALAASPMTCDDKGGWKLHLDRPLDAALREEARVAPQAQRTVLLPNGQTRRVPAREAASAAIREMRRLADGPGVTAREEEELAAAIVLVRLSGLIPGEVDTAPAAGTVIL